MGKGDKRLMNDGLFCIVYSTGITLKRKREKIKRKAFDKIGKKKKEKQIKVEFEDYFGLDQKKIENNYKRRDVWPREINDEPTWRCHQNPFVGALGIQEPVILGEPQIKG